MIRHHILAAIHPAAACSGRSLIAIVVIVMVAEIVVTQVRKRVI